MPKRSAYELFTESMGPGVPKAVRLRRFGAEWECLSPLQKQQWKVYANAIRNWDDTAVCPLVPAKLPTTAIPPLQPRQASQLYDRCKKLWRKDLKHGANEDGFSELYATEEELLADVNEVVPHRFTYGSPEFENIMYDPCGGILGDPTPWLRPPGALIVQKTIGAVDGGDTGTDTANNHNLVTNGPMELVGGRGVGRGLLAMVGVESADSGWNMSKLASDAAATKKQKPASRGRARQMAKGVQLSMKQPDSGWNMAKLASDSAVATNKQTCVDKSLTTVPRKHTGRGRARQMAKGAQLGVKQPDSGWQMSKLASDSAPATNKQTCADKSLATVPRKHTGRGRARQMAKGAQLGVKQPDSGWQMSKLASDSAAVTNKLTCADNPLTNVLEGTEVVSGTLTATYVTLALLLIATATAVFGAICWYLL